FVVELSLERLHLRVRIVARRGERPVLGPLLLEVGLRRVDGRAGLLADPADDRAGGVVQPSDRSWTSPSMRGEAVRALSAASSASRSARSCWSEASDWPASSRDSSANVSFAA